MQIRGSDYISERYLFYLNVKYVLVQPVLVNPRIFDVPQIVNPSVDFI
jgi:hypothetical protein